MSHKFAVIGDSHECVEELRSLITKIKASYPQVQFVHVGDGVDKGGNTKAMVEYLFHRLHDSDIFIRGNHEAFVYGRLEGILSALDDPVKEAKVFGSQAPLLADPELARKFQYIYEHGEPFFTMMRYDYFPGNRTLPKMTIVGHVTHAPCLREHLGKTDPISIRAQRNYRTIDRTIPTVEDLKWFYDDADNDPEGLLHIFGHMAHSGKTLAECQYKNKIFLDTGCVYGNGLSSVIVEDGKVVDYFFEKSLGNRQGDDVLPPPLGLRQG